MIIKVARALCALGPHDPDKFMANDGQAWLYYVPMAKVAIEAMREPTGIMCDAFNDAFPTPEGETLLRDIAPVVFNAMLDAAIVNSPPKAEGKE